MTARGQLLPVSMWAISLVAAALLVTQVGYRLLEHNQSYPVGTADSSVADKVPASLEEDRTASRAHDSGQGGRPQSSGLQQRLLTMSEAERNQILYLILRDAGAECIEVEDSQYFIAESGAWHAHCGETHTFSIVIDAFGSISVYPIPYGDFDRLPMQVLELR